MPALRRLRLENMSSYFVAQAGLELAVFLPQTPRCYDYRSGPLDTAQMLFLTFSLCVYVVCLWVFTYGGGQSLVSGCLSHSFLSYTPFLPFETRSFIEPRVSHFTRVTGHLTPEVCLSPPLQCWVTVTYASFAWVLGPQVQVFIIDNKLFMQGAISLAPVS